MANIHTIHQAFGLQDEDSSVFWLPMYHDMGLVGGVLVPVFAGVTNVSISPAAFLQSPITWLAAIGKYRATISGGPNFAYDLCIRKISEERRATLDLSSWALAFLVGEFQHARQSSRILRLVHPQVLQAELARVDAGGVRGLYSFLCRGPAVGVWSGTVRLSDILYLSFVFIDILALFRRIRVKQLRVESCKSKSDNP
jgi:acyl-CoA synthetase (AMP-forming)/AMP-acid ligase II